MESETLSLLNQAIGIAIKLVAPLLLASMAVGLLISIIQAATQIQEQTITFVPKLLVLALILLAAGPWMLQTLVDFFRQVTDLMVRI